MSSAQNNDKPKPIEEYLKKADILIDKRFLYFAFNCLGKKAEIQLQNGKKAQGNFNTANLDHGGIVLKNFSEGDSKENAASTKILNREDFVYILIPNVEEPPLVNAKKGVFRTDAEISKAKGPAQRKLVKWNADDAPAPESSGLVLEDLADQKGKWNQFELNQKKFGLKSDFEENMYTTHLNMKNVSSDLLEKAARLEAEILNSTNDYGNRHIREERGLQALQEDNENEEEAYSSVIRTTEKKIERVSSKTEPAEEKKFKGFTNSKREKPAESASLQVPAESNRDIKESVGNNAAKKEVPPVNIPIVESKPNENEREGDKTPQGDDKSENPLSRQTSNLSDEASNSHRHKARLSLKANSFENPGEAKPKEEAKAKEEEKPKAALAKQVSMEVDSEKKFNLSDYNSGAITKFKLKVNEKEIKKSSLPFFEIAIPNWQKKVGAPDPSAVNTSWKIAKAAPVSVPVVKTAPTVSSAATAKPFTKTTAPAFTGGLPNYPRPADNMMYPPPFVPAGFVPNNPMGFMPYPMPQQKFQPGVYPYPQNFQPQFTPYVDPNQPSFNMNYPHNNTNNPNNTNSRQGSGKNFNKKT